jgi:hypothetical protein
MQSELGFKTENELVDLAIYLFKTTKKLRENFSPPSNSHIPKNVPFSDLELQDKKTVLSSMDIQFKHFIEAYPIVSHYILENSTFHPKAFRQLLKRIEIINAKPQQHRPKNYTNQKFLESRSAYAHDLVIHTATAAEKRDRNNLRKRAQQVRADAARAIEEAQNTIDENHEEAKKETQETYDRLRGERNLEILQQFVEDWNDSPETEQFGKQLLEKNLEPMFNLLKFRKLVFPELLKHTDKHRRFLHANHMFASRGLIDEETQRNIENRKMRMIEHVDEKEYERFPDYLKHKSR